MTAIRDIGERDTKWLYRVGGSSGVALGISHIAIIGVYVAVGVPPKGVEERLVYHAAHTVAWWWILGLSVLTDLPEAIRYLEQGRARGKVVITLE